MRKNVLRALVWTARLDVRYHGVGGRGSQASPRQRGLLCGLSRCSSIGLEITLVLARITVCGESTPLAFYS